MKGKNKNKRIIEVRGSNLKNLDNAFGRKRSWYDPYSKQKDELLWSIEVKETLPEDKSERLTGDDDSLKNKLAQIRKLSGADTDEENEDEWDDEWDNKSEKSARETSETSSEYESANEYESASKTSEIDVEPKVENFVNPFSDGNSSWFDSVSDIRKAIVRAFEFWAVGDKAADESIISNEQIAEWFKLTSPNKKLTLTGTQAGQIFNNGWSYQEIFLEDDGSFKVSLDGGNTWFEEKPQFWTKKQVELSQIPTDEWWNKTKDTDYLAEFRKEFRAVGDKAADENIVSDEEITEWFILDSPDPDKNHSLTGTEAAQIFNNGWGVADIRLEDDGNFKVTVDGAIWIKYNPLYWTKEHIELTHGVYEYESENEWDDESESSEERDTEYSEEPEIASEADNDLRELPPENFLSEDEAKDFLTAILEFTNEFWAVGGEAEEKSSIEILEWFKLTNPNNNHRLLNGTQAACIFNKGWEVQDILLEDDGQIKVSLDGGISWIDKDPRFWTKKQVEELQKDNDKSDNQSESASQVDDDEETSNDYCEKIAELEETIKLLNDEIKMEKAVSEVATEKLFIAYEKISEVEEEINLIKRELESKKDWISPLELSEKIRLAREEEANKYAGFKSTEQVNEIVTKSCQAQEENTVRKLISSLELPLKEDSSLNEVVGKITELLTDKPNNVQEEQTTINKLQDELAEKEAIIARLKEQVNGVLPTYEQSQGKELKESQENSLPVTEEVVHEKVIELKKQLQETKNYRDLEITKREAINNQFAKLKDNFTQKLEEQRQKDRALNVGFGFLLMGSLLLAVSLFKKVTKRKRKKC